MLSEAQLAHLEHIVHSISAELQVEEATLDTQQTLTLVLCNETICFRPLHHSCTGGRYRRGAGRTAQGPARAPGMAALSAAGYGLGRAVHASGQPADELNERLLHVDAEVLLHAFGLGFELGQLCP